MKRVVVIGIGNVLNADDGIGPYVARVLDAGWEMAPGAEVMDAGTPGLDLVSVLHAAEAVVVVDAVRDRGAPGEVRRYDREQILRGGPTLAMSPHEPGLRDALLTMEFQGGAPSDVTLWGAIPASVELATELTPAARAAVPALVDGVLAELHRLGVEARRRAEPRAPDIWWERRTPA
jgi:hydrogenase maturation protease